MNKHKLLLLIDKFITKYLSNIFGLIILIPFILIDVIIRTISNKLWWIIRDIKKQYERTIKST